MASNEYLQPPEYIPSQPELASLFERIHAVIKNPAQPRHINIIPAEARTPAIYQLTLEAFEARQTLQDDMARSIEVKAVGPIYPYFPFHMHQLLIETAIGLPANCADVTVEGVTTYSISRTIHQGDRRGYEITKTPLELQDINPEIALPRPNDNEAHPVLLTAAELYIEDSMFKEATQIVPADLAMLQRLALLL